MFRVSLFTFKDTCPKFENLLDTIVNYEVNNQSGIQSCISSFGKAGVGWRNKTHGITHLHFLTADSETCLQNYAKSDGLIGRFENVVLPNLDVFYDRYTFMDSMLNYWGITAKPAGTREDIVVFNSKLRLPKPFVVKEAQNAILHVTLFKMTGLDKKWKQKLDDIIKQHFNSRDGIVAQFSAYAPVAGDLDRSCGYTHVAIVVADDLQTLKSLLDSDAHKQTWVETISTKMDSILVFDLPLGYGMVSEA